VLFVFAPHPQSTMSFKVGLPTGLTSAVLAVDCNGNVSPSIEDINVGSSPSSPTLSELAWPFADTEVTAEDLMSDPNIGTFFGLDFSSPSTGGVPSLVSSSDIDSFVSDDVVTQELLDFIAAGERAEQKRAEQKRAEQERAKDASRQGTGVQKVRRSKRDRQKTPKAQEYHEQLQASQRRACALRVQHEALLRDLHARPARPAHECTCDAQMFGVVCVCYL
jgi:hypothetical protein